MIDFKLLSNCSLFNEIHANEYEHLLKCLNARIKHYKKEDIIIKPGDKIHELGVLMKGNIHILNYDFWGNRTIQNELREGELFAEAYACNPTTAFESFVVAAQDCEVLYLDVRSIVTPCPNICTFHVLLSKNLLRITSSKNILLTRKIAHLSKRTTREKILSYLQDIDNNEHSINFTIPFNRQELADYLCVDRSALSNELSKMKNEGLIDFDRNRFKLINSR